MCYQLMVSLCLPLKIIRTVEENLKTYLLYLVSVLITHPRVDFFKYAL